MSTRPHSLQARSSDQRMFETHHALRTVGIIGLVDVALIHLVNLPGTIQETPYLGWLTIAVIAASGVVAAMLIHNSNRLAWALAAVCAGATNIAFVLSRTVGLPRSTEDIGNWTEPLGVASLVVEAVIIGTAAWAIWLHGSAGSPFSARRTATRRAAHRRPWVRGAAPVHRPVLYRHTVRGVRAQGSA